MKTIRFLALIAFLPLLAQAQTQWITTTSTNDPTRIKVTRIAVTNNVIVTPQSVTSGAVNGTNAGPGVSGQVVKLNGSGLVDSTLLPASSTASLLSTNLSRFDINTSSASTWVLLGTLNTTKSGIVYAVARAVTTQSSGYGSLGIGVGATASTNIVASLNLAIASQVQCFNVSYTGTAASNTVISFWGAMSVGSSVLTNSYGTGNIPQVNNSLGLTVLQLPQ